MTMFGSLFLLYNIYYALAIDRWVLLSHAGLHDSIYSPHCPRYMLTCGTDGDVRVWDGVEDDNVTSHRVGGRVYCIAFKVNVALFLCHALRLLLCACQR